MYNLRSSTLQNFVMSQSYTSHTIQMDNSTLTTTLNSGTSFSELGLIDGHFYFEVICTKGNCRIGIGNKESLKSSFLGNDSHSYCIDTNDGFKYTKHKKNVYMRKPKNTDIIGVLFGFSDTPPQFKYIDDRDECSISKYSFVSFFVNGFNCGIAYEFIETGTYFAAVSLYEKSEVEMNLGPYYAFPECTNIN